jgi:hypothetical protein
MPDIPEGIVLKRHRDLEGRGWHVWLQRACLLVLTAFIVTALLDVFGQRPSTTSAASAAATLELNAPDSFRGGLLWGAQIRVHAHRDVKNAILVLDSGWLDGFTMNTMQPTPLGSASRDGKLVLTLGHIPAGHTYTLWMQFQVNATQVGVDTQDVVLLDGQQRLAELKRSVTTYP